MEQNTQSSENNNQAEDSVGSGQIFNEPRKKSNKKIVLLVAIILIIIGVGTVYFLFLKMENNDKWSAIDNVDVAEKEVEIDKELDSDQDGLPDYIEKVLGTYLHNSDTDGDGYSDFEEIKDGYDPLGDEKYTEEEWEAVKEKISDEKLYEEIFGVEKKKTINFSQLIETCENIKDETYKYACIIMACDLTKSKEERIKKCLNDNDIDHDTCLMAIMPLTAEVCDSLSNDSYKNDCYSMVVRQTKDISMCERNSNDMGRKVTCYKNLALAKNDSEICQKIDYNYFKEWCMADSTKDFSICRSLKDGTLYWDEAKLDDWKNICLGAVTGDVNYCEKINEESVKPSCYKDIAVKRNDLSICDKIESDNNSNRDECYMRVAIKREDDSLCGELSGKFKEQCYNQISLQRADFSFCKEYLGVAQYQCYYHAILLSSEYFDINQDKELSFCEEVE